MTGWIRVTGGRLRAADGDVRNAWLLTVELAVAFVCAAETMARLGFGTMDVAAAMCAFAFCGLMTFAAFRPVTGGLATLLWWMSLCVSPAPMPSSMMLGALLAVGVLGYARHGLGVAVALLAVGVWGFARGGLSIAWLVAPGGGSASSGGDAVGAAPMPSPSATPSVPPGDAGGHTILGAITLNGVLPVAALFAGFLIGGVAARWGRERDRAEAELSMRRRRERAAQDIHDYVSNDLAYVILRLDRDIADGRAVDPDELRELRAAAAKALGHTHEVITLIEGDDGNSGAGSGPVGGGLDGGDGPADGGDTEAIAGLRDQCERYERRLRALGFDGQTIITAQPGAHLPAVVRELLGGFVEELYTNIGKHADPAGGYVLTIRVAGGGVDIALVDTPAGAAAETGGLSAGTGLGRYRARIEGMGGSLTIHDGGPAGLDGSDGSDSSADGEWALAASIPTA